MPASPIRLVLDTNVVLRGLLNTGSASGRLLEAIDQRRVVLLLSKPVLAEYRTVLTDATLTQRYPELTLDRVEVALRRFRYFGDYLRVVRARFDFARDPRDAMFLELAIAGAATDLVSSDNDLLSLTSAHTDAAKRLRRRLPNLEILTPLEFLNAHSATLG